MGRMQLLQWIIVGRMLLVFSCAILHFGCFADVSCSMFDLPFCILQMFDVQCLVLDVLSAQVCRFIKVSLQLCNDCLMIV